MKKRILSLALILTMLVAFIPGFAADETGVYTYNFMRLRTGQWSSSAIEPQKATDWGWEYAQPNYHNFVTDPFIYHGQSENATLEWVPSSSNAPGFGPHFYAKGGEWCAWQIRVDSDGRYLPTLHHITITTGGVCNVYLAPKDAENPRAQDYLIGSLNTYGQIPSDLIATPLSARDLSAGDYVLTFEAGAGQTAKSFWFNSFSLTPADGTRIEVSAPALAVNVGATKTLTPTFSLGGVPLEASELDSLTAESANTEYAVATVENGVVTVRGIKAGTATVKISAKRGDALGSASFTVTVIPEEVTDSEGKTKPTYITYEKRAAAASNISSFTWARTQAQGVLASAESYTKDLDFLWDLVTSQDLPRGLATTTRWDPKGMDCHYCGKDIVAYTGKAYPWLYDVVNMPWKLQCPSCRRYFPSNDFGTFYETGLNEHGFFDYELAKQEGSRFLTNDLYPEKGTGWGVDDGYGYVTNETFTQLLGYGTTYRRHTYISYYNHWAVWYGGAIKNILNTLAHAYAYTGDLKYGRAGAILIDRIADVYPDMYVSEYFPTMSNSDFNTARGRIVGGIWESGLMHDLCSYYDYFYPAYDDPQVVSYLADKAYLYSLGDARGAHGTALESRGGVGNDKSTPAKIRQNIENGMLREVLDAILYENQIYGNSGMHQSCATMAAVVLDTMPETANALDWVMNEGGAVNSTLLGTVDRDGQGVEAAPGYSDTWVISYLSLVDALESYEGYAGANLYQNPKFVKLLKTNFPLTLTRTSTAPIGDSGAFANNSIAIAIGRLINAYTRTRDPEIAQYIYFLNGNTTENLRGDIFSPTAEIAAEVKKVIETYGEYPFDESSAMTGSFGFFALRDGAKKSKNTQRDFWMNFGRTTNHGHPSVLNIGMDAFGTPVLSDFGYPESTSGTNRTLNWDRSTIIHNTVQVNDTKQAQVTSGTALHFDGDNDGRVQLMDARNPNAYPTTSEYRRTLVMVDYDNAVSYGVDFFRVKGGSSHTFALHPVSKEAPTAENLTFQKQTSGTYAGSGVSYGNYAKTSGYDGFYNVSHATPSGPYSLDYKINNFRSLGDTSLSLHLKITQLHNFTPTKVSIASAEPPQTGGNPAETQSLLVDRRGNNLDSLFTTVYQPYDSTPYIAKSEVVSIARIGGATPGSGDTAYAVKVTMTNGREDYIVYATNNSVRYRIDNLFDFQGFVGVVTRENGVTTHRFISDGTYLDGKTTTAAYTGTVRDFTKSLSFENSITVTPDAPMDAKDLVGRYIFIRDNAHSYKIKTVTENADGTVTLGIGDFSLINGVGYTYDIAAGNSFSIPLSREFAPLDVNLQTTNGAQIRLTGNQGLRFVSRIAKSLDFSRVVEFGTLLIPSDDITNISQLQIGATFGDHTVAKIPAKYLYAETEDAITFTAVITNIATKNYTRSYTARAYAIFDDGTVVYPNTGASRSVYQVALLGLENPNESERNKRYYQEIISAVSDNDYTDNWD